MDASGEFTTTALWDIHSVAYYSFSNADFTHIADSPPFGITFPIIDLSNQVSDYFSFDDTGANPDWKFRDLFMFEEELESDNYSGWEDPIGTGKQLINIKNTLLEGGGASGGGPEPFPLNFRSMFLQVTSHKASDASWSIGLGWYFNVDLSYAEALIDAEYEIAGDFSEIDIVEMYNFNSPLNKNYYLNVAGRMNESGYVIENPIEIMRDIATNEVGIDPDYINEQSFNTAYYQHVDVKFAFSLTEEMESKDLLEDLARFTMCYPHFDNIGQLLFPCIKQNYFIADYFVSKTIKEKDIIKYSFSKTKPELSYSSIHFFYNYSHSTEEYASSWKSMESIQPSMEELHYMGYETLEDNIWELNCDYLRAIESASWVRSRLFYHNKYTHLLFKLTLPISYIELEIGSIVKFTELIGGLKAFGIDYTKVVAPVGGGNGGFLYPLFFVKGITKNLDKIDVELIQIHHLTGGDGFEEGSQWADAGLVLSSDFIEEPPPEVPIEFPSASLSINLGNMQEPAYEHQWYFQNSSHRSETYSEDRDKMQAWFTPAALGLSSYDVLIPTDLTGYAGNFINDYTVFTMHLRTLKDPNEHDELDEIVESYVEFRLSNKLWSTTDIELDWWVKEEGGFWQLVSDYDEVQEGPVGDVEIEGITVWLYSIIPTFRGGGFGQTNNCKYGSQFLTAYHDSRIEGFSPDVYSQEDGTGYLTLNTNDVPVLAFGYESQGESSEAMSGGRYNITTVSDIAMMINRSLNDEAEISQETDDSTFGLRGFVDIPTILVLTNSIIRGESN